MNELLNKVLNTKNKKVIIILFCFGIILMLMSNLFPNQNSKIKNESIIETSKFDDDKLKKELQSILCNIEGAGEVEVMIVFDNNYEKIVAKDTKSSIKSEEEDTSSRDVDTSTVMVKEGNLQQPYIIKEVNPTVRGVLVIAEGANNNIVKTNIKNAVKTVLNVPIHKVEVLTKK